MEEEAQPAAKRLKAIVDSAVDGILAIDPRGLIVSANPATVQMFGYDLEELIGANVSVLMPPPFRDEHDEYVANYLRTGDAKIIGSGREVPGRRKNGDIFPLYLAVSEAAVESSMDAVRVFGGAGYATANGIERGVRDALGGLFASGSSEMQWEIIAKGMNL